MKKRICGSLLVVTALALGSASGCQSGWKFSNPFSRAPKASSAQTPSELEELDELDGLTPPPENYTKRDDSLAQKGKYSDGSEDAKDVSEKETSLAANEKKSSSDSSQTKKSEENSVSVAASETPKLGADTSELSNATARYDATEPADRQTSETSLAQKQNAPVANGISAVPSEQSLASSSSDRPQTTSTAIDAPNAVDPFANLAASSAFPAPAAPSDALADLPAAPNASNALENSAFPAPATDLDPFPTAPTTFANDQASPAAQANGNDAFVYSTGAPNAAPEKVALDYDPYAAPPSQSVFGSAQDSDPYSNVYYDPQTTSGGFAPGSTGLY